MPSWDEQALCIGATFAVAATNGRDPARRLNILGFCQSVDVLHEAVEDVVASRGGEVLEHERELKSGVHERLKLTVCIPFLWGVPPEAEALSAAISSSGGIIDRVFKQWGMYRLPVGDGFGSARAAGLTAPSLRFPFGPPGSSAFNADFDWRA